MPNKKEWAGSAKNGVASNQKVGSGDCNQSANIAVADLIEHIEAVFAAVDFAGAPDVAFADIVRPCPAIVPIEQCHASISYVRKHQASSINLFWSRASPAAGPDADEGIERLWQPETAKI